MIRVRRHMSENFSVERLRLEARRSRGPLVVYLGIVILALGAGAVILRNINVQYPWSSPQQLRVVVDNAAGVKSGLNQVRISGVQVGKITSADLVGGRAVLSVSINDGQRPVYKDARFELRPQTALEDMYLNVVDRGTPAAGSAKTGEPIEAARTRTPVSASAVLNTFNGDTRARMETLMDELGVGLGDRGDQLRDAIVEILPFLQSARQFSSSIAQRGGQTRRLVRNLRLLTEELGTRDESLRSLVRRGATTVDALSANAPALDRLLAELPGFLEDVPPAFSVVRSGLDRVDPALDELRPTAAALDDGLQALDEIVRDADPALAALRKPVRDLQPLARNLPPTARDLDRAFAALQPVALRLDRVTRKISGCKTGVAGFFQWNPSVFKFSDNGGTVPRGDVSQGAESAGGLIRTPNLKQYPTCVNPGSAK